MSTKTKNPKISQEHKEKIDSLKTTQDLYNELDEYQRKAKSKTNNLKDRLAKDISESGEVFAEEMHANTLEQEKIYKEYSNKVEEIIKLEGNTYGTLAELNEMSTSEIDSIYNKVKEDNKKSFFTKLLDFFMGW